jgi:hypothetical protein
MEPARAGLHRLSPKYIQQTVCAKQRLSSRERRLDVRFTGDRIAGKPLSGGVPEAKNVCSALQTNCFTALRNSMLYVHIGAQKTGTTTIQKALFENKGVLRAHGLNYLDVLPDDPNKQSHYNSVRGFFSSNAIEISRTESFVKTVKDPSQNYLISAENLSNWPVTGHGDDRETYIKLKRACLTKIKSAFSEHEVTVILCVRNQRDYLKSLFKQHLKVTDRVTRSIDQSLHDFLGREIPRSDFALEAELWAECFAKVHVIDFEACKNGSLIDTFLAAVDLSGITLKPVVDQNISPDWTSLEARRMRIATGAKPGNPIPEKRQDFNKMVNTYVTNTIKARLKGQAS